MRITEFAYGGKVAGAGGGDGEYAELTNIGDAPADLTGWTYDNSVANAATGLSLSSLGTVAPGESVIVTDLSAAEFRSDWGLKGSVKVLSNGKTHTLNGGPNAIHVYDNTGAEVDSVSYASGFESAKGKAAWVDAAHVGAKADTTGWTIATVGDAEGSWTSTTGSVGSPGVSSLGGRTPASVRLAGALRITEFAYGGKVAGAGGGDGEYAELTNIGGGSVDLTGWTYDNSTATAATGLSLSSLGTVAAGESVIVTDLSAAEFRTDWNLKDSVKVLSNGKTHTLNGGPNSIHVYDNTGAEVDSVSYASGFESAKGKAAWVDAAHVGAKADTTGWTIATDGDSEGSWTSATGSIGSPGASTLGTETPADVKNGGGTGTTPDDPHYSDIVINEITSDNTGTVDFAPNPNIGDAIELYNKGTHSIDLAGWKQIDSGDASAATVFSAGLYVDGALSTVIPAGHYGVFQSTKGLGSGGDAVKVYTQNGTLVDSLTYTAGQAGVDETVNTDHTYHSLAACPDGSDTFKEVPASTFGGANGDCPGGIDPLTGGGGTGPEAPCDTEDSGTAPGTIPAGVLTWPGSASPTTIDAQCAWVTTLSGQDLSGLAFDPNNADVLYAVKNKSHVYRLVRVPGGWAKDTANGWSDGKDIRFPGNTGLPDSEGLTVAPDGSLFITTERDNAASGVPLDSILKFDPTSSATTLVASDQWVLTGDLNFTNADANLGFEGVAYVPDSFLTAAGFRTDDGSLYNPANYTSKIGGGLFFGAVEKTGHLRAYVLNSDHTYVRVADIDTGMVGVMDASFDPDLGRIWAHCDNTCGNATALLKVGANGHFAVDRSYSTPASLPNYNLEGFAVAPASTATNGTREVLWTDDGNRFGHSLWSGTINLALGLDQTLTPTPAITGTPVFGGSLSAGVGTWDQGVTTHYQWKDGSTVLASDTALPLTDPALVGKTITLAVTGSRTGFADATTTATVEVAGGVLTTHAPTLSGAAVVGKTLSAKVAPWGPGSVKLAYTWLANGQPIPGATAGTLRLTAAQLGKTISVRVAGTSPGYVAATAQSTATAKVKPGTITAKRPSVSGAAKVGKSLVAHPGTWTAAGAKVVLRYQWLVNGKVIRGATKASLKLVRAYRGKKITVKVTGTASGYTTIAKISAPTRKVK